MSSVTVQEAQTRLAELIRDLGSGEEVVITENDRPVAKLVAEKPTEFRRPQPGLCKGMITVVADDDEHLEHFAEYMP